MKFKNAFIKTHSPEQVRAVVDEAKRLGYSLLSPMNYKDVATVIFYKDGCVALDTDKTGDFQSLLCAFDYLEVKQTRHIRRDLCDPTISQDGQAVLAVTSKPTAPEPVSPPWRKPEAYNPLVRWGAGVLLGAYVKVRNIVSAFIRHIK